MIKTTAPSDWKLFDRAFIVKFKSAHDLHELILRMNFPLEKQAQVKGNRLFRVFVKTEFHALKEMREMGVPGELIEEINKIN